MIHRLMNPQQLEPEPPPTVWTECEITLVVNHFEITDNGSNR